MVTNKRRPDIHTILTDGKIYVDCMVKSKSHDMIIVAALIYRILQHCTDSDWTSPNYLDILRGWMHRVDFDDLRIYGIETSRKNAGRLQHLDHTD